MDARNPESMTAAERRAEIVGILARGLGRWVPRTRVRGPASDSGAQLLEASEDASVSVALRPAGEGRVSTPATGADA